MPVNTPDKTSIERLYTELLEAIDRDDSGSAIRMVVTLDNTKQRIDLLTRFAAGLASDLSRARTYALSHARAHMKAITRARDGALALALDLSRDGALARAHMRALEIVRDFEPARNLSADFEQVYTRCHAMSAILNNLLGDNTAPVLQTGMTLTGIDALTPATLTDTIAPYVQALADVQQIIVQLTGAPYLEPQIGGMSQGAAIRIALTGVNEACDIARSFVVPWRHDHIEQMARLKIQDNQVEIEQREAEIAAWKTLTAAPKTRHRHTRVENEKARLELHRAKIALAAQIIDQFAPDLSEAERLVYMTQLLQPLTILTESPLEIEADTD